MCGDLRCNGFSASWAGSNLAGNGAEKSAARANTFDNDGGKASW